MSKQLLVAVLMLLSWSTWASQWQVDHNHSRIGFVASYDGIEFEGWFETWDAVIEFESSREPTGNMQVTIQMGSVNSQSRDRDNGMRGQDWFWVMRFPQAVFVADVFVPVAGDDYLADGHLAIRERRQALRVPFTWTVDKDGQANLRGNRVVDRRQFDIGTGEWAADPIIGFSVRIVYQLVLRRQE